MRHRRQWSIVALAGGALCLLVGLSLVGMYVSGAIIEPMGQPDQSLLYWMLPFLFIGVGATLFGAVMIALGIRGIRDRAGGADGRSGPDEQGRRTGPSR